MRQLSDTTSWHEAAKKGILNLGGPLKMNSTYDDLWVPGNLAWDQLDFNRNCTAWGQWLAGLVQPDPWDPSINRGMSMELSMLLFLNALPDNYTVNYTLPTWYADVSSWFAYNMMHTPVPADGDPKYYLFSDRFNTRILQGPKVKCEAEFCKAVGYTGSQDLCGIGVVVSYFLEALLGTMYLVVFTIHQTIRRFNKNKYKKPRKPNASQSVSGRILDSFRGSLDMFLSGAMLIAVAMLGAALYAAIDGKEERDKVNPDLPSGEAVYETALSLIASNFSVFPVMLLYALVKHDGHRKWLHRSVLFIMWGLSASVVYIAPRAEIDWAQRKSGVENFDCDQRGSQYWHVVKAVQFLVIGLPLLWLVITVFITTGFKIPGMVDRPWVKALRGIWRLLIAWINLFIMWGILAYFTIFRQKIIDAAGGLDKNDRWTFGQVFALAAWVPVIAELFYILAFGLEDSLSGHMPSDYHASHNISTAQLDPNMGQPLLHRDSTYDARQTSVYSQDSMYDLKQVPTNTTSEATLASPGTQTAHQTAWHNPDYQPFGNQHTTNAQRHQSWDPYYHTGW
ncbi:hypothetical protein CkaCkLH20_08832 [Colletotrichum karsti]|uniref:C6 zinc finger domain containing protein n=1 Tax=Colletotrichum karsti TaxID=1095194 RepID=A0A9P6LIK9_9PEZI|nr:uncharacterized protein CkaCkLH20_08832 [Colletotrichum karsti]KAF9873722.1 hypothetical protein CkaCkLH20_08832 [Colletotrichum karsti]